MRRAGYTLLELVLVLVILVAATAISIPLIQTMLTDARMTASGDMVRGRLADARSSALEQGRPWKVAYIANTGYLRLAPEDASDWDNTENTPIDSDDLIREHLPTDIVFAANQTDIADSDEPGTPGSKWETIAVYLVDGSARDDTTVYFGKPGWIPMRAKLRALTGAVTVEIPYIVKEGVQP